MIDENKFLDAFGDIDDEFLLEEYDNCNKSKKIIRFEKYLNKAQNIAQKNHKKFISIASVSIIAIAIGVVFLNQKTNTLDNIVLKEDGKEFMNDENNKVSGSDSKKNLLKEVSSIKKMESDLGFTVPVLDKEVDKYFVIGEKNRDKQGRIIYKDGTEFDIVKGDKDIIGIPDGKFFKTETIQGVNISYYSADSINYAIWSNKGYSYSYQNIYGKIDKAELNKLIKLTNN